MRRRFRDRLPEHHGDAAVLEAVIEIPKGCRNKYEFDPDHGVIRLDRTLFTATQFPADYGFIRHTASEDGDPLDTMVLLQEPTFPGCWILVRAVGVFWMHDEAGTDPKLLCVPARDPWWAHVRDVGDAPPFLLAEIRHFFTVYKQLEPGKSTRCYGWQGVEVADVVVRETQLRARGAAAPGTEPTR